MKPTSPAQEEAARRRVPPAVEEVRPGLWALPSRIPITDHIPIAFIWAVLDQSGGVHLVDAGFDTPENRVALGEQLKSLGARIADIRNVVVTHLHPDHLGMAPWLRAEYGTELIMSRIEAEAYPSFALPPVQTVPDALLRWEVPVEERAMFGNIERHTVAELVVDRTVEDGDILHLGDMRLRVEATPGHTRGHIILADDEKELIFSGDHVLPTMHPGITGGSPSASNPLADFLASCAAMERYADYEVLPGHGYRFLGISERAASSAAHALRRAAEVSEIVTRQPHATVWQIARRLSWTAGWDQFDAGFRFTALRQTEFYLDYVRSDEFRPPQTKTASV